MPEIDKYYSTDALRHLGVKLTPDLLHATAMEAWSDIRKGKAFGLKSVLMPDEADLWAHPDYAPFRQAMRNERLGWKLSALSSIGAHYAAVKIVGANGINRQLGHPRSRSTILLSDRFTMRPLCILDGTDISAGRTGSYASLMLDLFFTDADKFSVFVFGAGPVARWAIIMLAHFGREKIDEILVRSRTDRSASELADALQPSLGLPIRVVRDNRHLPRCGLVITATSSDRPVFDADEIGPDAVLLHLSGDETPAAHVERVLRSGTVLCDDISLVSHRNSQSLARYFSRRGASLEQLGPLLGVRDLKDHIPQRVRREGPVLVTCVGLPVLDLYLAGAIYERWILPHRPGSTRKAA